MTCSSAVVFCTSGGSASSGSAPSTRDTRSRTSLAALSISRDSSNSTLILERPSRLLERMVLIPSMPAMASSIGCVILVSTTAAEAPG